MRRAGISEAQSRGGTQRPPFSIGPQENRGVVCAVCDSQNVGRSVGLAFVNIPIAEAVITDVSDTQFYPKTIHKIQMMEASTILMPRTNSPTSKLTLASHIDEELRGVPVIRTSKADWSKTEGLLCVRDVAFKSDLPAVEFALGESHYAVCAFSAAMKYIHDELGFSFDKHSIRIKYQPPANVMMISLPTIQSLELLENAQYARSKDCLFGLLNRTFTPMGSRLLRNSIIQPSTQTCILARRFAVVSELARDDRAFFESQDALGVLKPLGDIEQLITKLVILPKDGSVYEAEQAINNILRLKSFLIAVPDLFQSISEADSDLLVGIRENCTPGPAQDVMQLIDSIIDHNASYATKPLELRNQRVHTVKHEVSASLDVQRKLYEDFTQKVHDYVRNLEGELGAKLMLKYSESRKFYLRIQAKEFGQQGIPAIFINRTHSKGSIDCQTLKIVQYNEQVNRAVIRAISESDEVIKKLLLSIRPHVHILYKYCESIALVDMLASFASLVRTFNYVQPEIQDTVFSLTEARHPILDFHGVNKCVPNDYFITDESRFQIITGQNMSGKSTYIRAIAMIHIMAQIGCFVPAESARLPIIHSLFARVSTDDMLEASLSTFSVEMREMAFVLRNVNSRSLVIVDELGRATSTRDGLAIAAAISEALLQSGATVYFATHFSELAKGLASRIGVTNRHMQTETQADISGVASVPTIKMLYRVHDGPEMEESYGISLARAIGFPASFIAKAESVADELRKQARANRTDEHELEEARRQKLVTGLVRQLRLGQQSQADDEELWRYLQEVNDAFWSGMLASGESPEVDEVGEGDEGDRESRIGDDNDYGHAVADELVYLEREQNEMSV